MTTTKKETKIEKAKRLNVEATNKAESQVCFGCFDGMADKCFDCLARKKCYAMQKETTFKAGKTSAKTTTKKKARRVSLADVFFLAVMQQSKGYIGLSSLAHDFGKLATLPNVKKAQKSIERSFAAHLTDVLLGKDKRYRQRGVKVNEGQGGLYVTYTNNQHVLDTLQANL